MRRILKTDAEVALDDVTRLTARSVRLLEDLGRLAEDRALAERLVARAARRSALLDDLGRALYAAGEAPADEDPERAHLQALWNKLKAALGAREPDVLRDALAEQDRELADAVGKAMVRAPSTPVTDALRALAAEIATDAAH
jgi:hypothetical protein